MALRVTRRSRVLLARTLHPEYRQVLQTFVRHQDMELVQVPYAASGQIDLASLESALNAADGRGGGAIAQFLRSSGTHGGDRGAGPSQRRSADRDHHRTASLAIVKPPSEADIVCGEAQSFGVPVAFGGPYVGFLTTKEKFLRQMPGRLVGQTVDTEGRRGFVLTLATREQHIRREKATSNICTNQSLCALAATIYLSLLGKNGLRLLAEQNLAKAHYAAGQLAAIPGVIAPFRAPHFNEFVVKAPGDAESCWPNCGKKRSSAA